MQFELVLDEGGMVLPGATLGIQQPVALIGIAEKGYISVTLEAHGERHSSRPPRRRPLVTWRLPLPGCRRIPALRA